MAQVFYAIGYRGVKTIDGETKVKPFLSKPNALVQLKYNEENLGKIYWLCDCVNYVRLL